MASFYVSNLGERDRTLALMVKIAGYHSTPNAEPPEDERDNGKEYAYLSDKHTPPNNAGKVGYINIEAPRPNDAGKGDDDNIKVMMQEEV